MSFKYFLAFTIIFCIAIGFYIHSLGWGQQELVLFNTHFVLPTSAWIVIIVLVFFAFSSLLFVGSWVAQTMQAYYLSKDFESLIKQMRGQAMGEIQKSQVFRDKYMRQISKILKHFEIRPIDSEISNQEKLPSHIERAITTFKQLKDGQVVDLKTFNLEKQNALVMWNLKNKIALEPKTALKVALNPDKFSADTKTRQIAVLQVLRHANKDDLRKLFGIFVENRKPMLKFARSSMVLDAAIEQKNTSESNDKKSSDSENVLFTHDMKEAFFDAYAKHKGIFSLELLSKAFEQMNFDEQDFLDFARRVQAILQPDEWHKLLNSLADLDENAETALFYVMFKLEMLDAVRERRAAHARDEFRFVDAYLDLRQYGKRYDLDIFKI